MNIKVTNTKMHRVSSYGLEYINVPVAEAKLVLVECEGLIKNGQLCKFENSGWFYTFSQHNVQSNESLKGIKPILISETEKIEVGDWVLQISSTNVKTIVQITVEEQLQIVNSIGSFKHYKILALPEHFSPSHLQAIVDGKLKEGKVVVECEKMNLDEIREAGRGFLNASLDKIKLNSSNHITLHEVEEKMYTVKEIIDELKYGLSKYGCKNEISGKWVLEDNIYHILNNLNKM